jgi:hypothetical protein
MPTISLLPRSLRVITPKSFILARLSPMIAPRLSSTSASASLVSSMKGPHSCIANRLVQFSLEDSSLIKDYGLIGGKWVEAKDGTKFKVTSEFKCAVT